MEAIWKTRKNHYEFNRFQNNFYHYPYMVHKYIQVALGWQDVTEHMNEKHTSYTVFSNRKVWKTLIAINRREEKRWSGLELRGSLGIPSEVVLR